MQVITAPNSIPTQPTDSHLLFLAGSIEMGKADNWQSKVIQILADTNWTILNPRRESWDDTWEQDINNPEFCEQVEWELDSLEKAEKVIMYFDPSTKSPITLLELGLFVREKKLLVICPKGYWRRGNVQVVCARYHIPLYEDLETTVAAHLSLTEI